MEFSAPTPFFNPNPSNEMELIHVVGRWSKFNFAHRRAAHLGVVEEIGEATRCVLKRIQGIRGFDKEEFFMAQFCDALADTIIYLADWCSERNAFFMFGRNMYSVQKLTVDDQNRILTHLLQAAAVMTQQADREPVELRAIDESDYNMVAQRICTGLEMWGQVYDIDLRLTVAHTWAKVSQRDWTKHPNGPEEYLT